jgi:hypothetical protein
MTVLRINGNIYTGLSSDTKPTDCHAGSIFFEPSGDCSIFNGSTWNKTSTAGARNVFLKNAAIISQGLGDGGVFNFSAAAGEVGRTGDLTQFGFPYGDVMLTKTGTTAIATVTWGVGTNGMVFFSISALNAADAINITAENSNGSVITGNIYYRSNGGAPVNAAIAAPAFITLYNGR